jgi:hypothetical protein
MRVRKVNDNTAGQFAFAGMTGGICRDYGTQIGVLLLKLLR